MRLTWRWVQTFHPFKWLASCWFPSRIVPKGGLPSFECFLPRDLIRRPFTGPKRDNPVPMSIPGCKPLRELAAVAFAGWNQGYYYCIACHVKYPSEGLNNDHATIDYRSRNPVAQWCPCFSPSFLGKGFPLKSTNLKRDALFSYGH